jgi:triacylglycerol lipase
MVCAAAALAGWDLVAGSVAGAAPATCGPAVRRVSARTRGTPVVFVHGFAGAPSDFRRRIDDHPSMLEAIGDLADVVTYTFDYREHSLDWVTNPTIGPALGRALACIAARQGHRVVVIAHSMGGLATRDAQGQSVDGHSVASSVARVITIGTPSRGAQLLGFAGGAGGDVLREVVRAFGLTCGGGVTTRPDRSLCDLLGATETQAVQAMIPGSLQLASLPPWAPGIRVDRIAGDIQVGVGGPFGFAEQFTVGDFAVSVESATAAPHAGGSRFVAECRASLFGLADAIDDSPCSHANEVANRRVVAHVRQLVASVVREERSRAASTTSTSTGA